jgi:hypothetical protein
MRRAFIGISCAAAWFMLGLGAPSSRAQQVLPQQFGKWALGGCPGFRGKIVAPDTPVSRESKLKTAGSEFYCNGSLGVTAVIYTFGDPTGAYEFYTSELRAGMSATTLGGATAVDSEHLLTLLGNFVVSVAPPKNISDADLLLLLKPIKAKAMDAVLPPIRAFLPNEGMVQGTQRYAMGPAAFQSALETMGLSKFAVLTDEVGFRSGTEAMLATYAERGNKTQTLLLLDCPTPQLAEQHLRHIQPILAASAELASTTVERKGSLLSLVLSPLNEKAAAQLRSQINYGTEVTWNEPSQTLTDPPWVVVLKNIFLGTFAFCGLAMALGLAFGGLRVVTKKLLPGKVFDKPQDMEVLQLGLSGKRIDPSDFY